jgi:hypothetical protein
MSEVTNDAGLTDDAFDLAFEAALAEPETPGAEDASVQDEAAAANGQADNDAAGADADADKEKADADAAAKAEADAAVAAKAAADAEVAKTEAAKAAPPSPAQKKPAVDPAAEAAAKAKKEADDAEAKRLADEARAKEAYTEDEIAAVNETATNFPEVAKALKAVERVAFVKAENAFNAKLAEMAAQFAQQIAPLTSVVQRTAQNEHEAAILKVHPDAFTILPQVEQWAETQPSILKNAYNAVLDKGSTQDIIELFTVYKEATKAVTPPAAPAVDEAAKQQEVEKQKRLEAQEGVRGRNTSGRATVDPDDFDGAFEKFAAA